jgi:hypothetical protein
LRFERCRSRAEGAKPPNPRGPQGLAAVDLWTTAFAERGRGHGAALIAAAEAFLASKARVKRLVAVASPDEKAAAEVITKKFGFSRLNGRQARVLCGEFPALQVRGRAAAVFAQPVRARARAGAPERGRCGRGGGPGPSGGGACPSP